MLIDTNPSLTIFLICMGVLLGAPILSYLIAHLIFWLFPSPVFEFQQPLDIQLERLGEISSWGYQSKHYPRIPCKTWTIIFTGLFRSYTWFLLSLLFSFSRYSPFRASDFSLKRGILLYPSFPTLYYEYLLLRLWLLISISYQVLRTYYNSEHSTMLPTRYSVCSYAVSESAFSDTAMFLTPFRFKVPSSIVLATASTYATTPTIPDPATFLSI